MCPYEGDLRSPQKQTDPFHVQNCFWISKLHLFFKYRDLSQPGGHMTGVFPAGKYLSSMDKIQFKSCVKFNTLKSNLPKKKVKFTKTNKEQQQKTPLTRDSSILAGFHIPNYCLLMYRNDFPGQGGWITSFIPPHSPWGIAVHASRSPAGYLGPAERGLSFLSGTKVPHH